MKPETGRISRVGETFSIPENSSDNSARMHETGRQKTPTMRTFVDWVTGIITYFHPRSHNTGSNDSFHRTAPASE